MSLFKMKKKRAFLIKYYWYGTNQNIVVAYDAQKAMNYIRRKTTSHVQIIDVKEIKDFPF